MEGGLEDSRLRMEILDRFVPPGLVSISPGNCFCRFGIGLLSSIPRDDNIFTLTSVQSLIRV